MWSAFGVDCATWLYLMDLQRRRSSARVAGSRFGKVEMRVRSPKKEGERLQGGERNLAQTCIAPQQGRSSAVPRATGFAAAFVALQLSRGALSL